MGKSLGEMSLLYALKNKSKADKEAAKTLMRFDKSVLVCALVALPHSFRASVFDCMKRHQADLESLKKSERQIRKLGI